jgi:hypothetical protein
MNKFFYDRDVGTRETFGDRDTFPGTRRFLVKEPSPCIDQIASLIAVGSDRHCRIEDVRSPLAQIRDPLAQPENII